MPLPHLRQRPREAQADGAVTEIGLASAAFCRRLSITPAAAAGYTVVDPGRFQVLSDDFSNIIGQFKSEEVEIVVGEETFVFEHPEPADAYALAVLELLRRIA